MPSNRPLVPTTLSSIAQPTRWMVLHLAALFAGCTTAPGADDSESHGASESHDGGESSGGADGSGDDDPQDDSAATSGSPPSADSTDGLDDSSGEDDNEPTADGPDEPDPVVCDDGEYATADGECEPWAMTLVNTNPRQAALAVNGAGQRAVGYMHAPLVWQRVGLSTWNGEDWVDEYVDDAANRTFTHGIALEEDGSLHFADYDDYAYEVFYGQQTVKSEVFGYDGAFFPIDAEVGPVLAFRDGTSGHGISVARPSGTSGWSSDTWVTEGYPVEIRMVAMDDDGLCIAWSAEVETILFGASRVYARCFSADGTPIGPETVIHEIDGDERIRGLDLAASGPTLSLAVATSDGLSYLEGSGDMWSTTEIDDLDCLEKGAAVAVDSAGRPRLAYVCDWEDRLDPRADFIYAERTKGGPWVHHVVTRDRAVPAPETSPSIVIPTVTDIELDGDDTPYLLYEHDAEDDDDTQLRHVTHQPS